MAGIWSDGTNFTPALMFTYDPTFDPQGPHWEDVKRWCRKWDIDTERIIYIKPSKSSKKYVGAKKEHVGAWQQYYKEQLRGAKVIHDAGNEYKKNGHYILADGAAAHYVLTPETHGEVSPCDNRYFAIAKRWWRVERYKECGDNIAKQDLYLLYCMDFVSQEMILAQFDRNFLLKEDKPTLAKVEETLRECTRLTSANAELEASYLKAYERWVTDGGLDVPMALDHVLDGVYWK